MLERGEGHLLSKQEVRRALLFQHCQHMTTCVLFSKIVRYVGYPRKPTSLKMYFISENLKTNRSIMDTPEQVRAL